MTKFMRIAFVGIVGLLFTSAVSAQREVAGQNYVLHQDQQQEPIVKGAPYSGEGITTVKLTMYDGTKIERTVTAKFFRDSQGRFEGTDRSRARGARSRQGCPRNRDDHRPGSRRDLHPDSWIENGDEGVDEHHQECAGSSAIAIVTDSA